MSRRRIYVASSWRCAEQPTVVAALRAEGHEVYDFRNPPGKSGFAWSEVDPEWLDWTIEAYRDRLEHPRAVEGFGEDFAAMKWADTFVLVLPCGRSAHLEAGWAVGQGKPTAILLSQDKFEPELMYRMADKLAASLPELVQWVASLPPDPSPTPPTVEDVTAAIQRLVGGSLDARQGSLAEQAARAVVGLLPQIALPTVEQAKEAILERFRSLGYRISIEINFVAGFAANAVLALWPGRTEAQVVDEAADAFESMCNHLDGADRCRDCRDAADWLRQWVRRGR